MSYIDLHIHSIASDGTDSPKEIIEKAISKGLSAIAITDHDTGDGIDEAKRAAEGENIEVIPGIELSTVYAGREVHILGYFIDCDAECLSLLLSKVKNSRERRNGEVFRLMQNDGIPISEEMLKARYGNARIGRPHIASALVEQSYAKSVREAIETFLINGGKYYVPRERLPLEEVIEAIRSSGGLAVIAHPILYGFDDETLKSLVEIFRELGGTGLEAIYSTYTQSDEGKIRTLAQQNELLITGGSDYHGTRKPHIELGVGCGNLKVPYDILVKLKNCL